MKNNSLKEIWHELKGSKNVLITLHYRPDGDSLGSCAAMKYALEREGVKVSLISKDELSEGLKHFEFVKEVEFNKDIKTEDLDPFDCIILLDYAAAEGDFGSEFMENLKNRKVINLDHHNTNSYFGKMNYVDSGFPSACSLLIKLFQENRVPFDEGLCRRLILGICTDTNFGEYGNSEESFGDMAFLIKKGKINFRKDFVDPIKNSVSWDLKKLSGILLIHMKKVELNGKPVVYSWARKADYRKNKMEVSDIRQGIFCMQDINNTDLVFSLTEINGGIKGSFRSRTFDTTIYSEALGGGGHKKASAFILKDKNMKNAITKVLRVIKEKGFVSAD